MKKIILISFLMMSSVASSSELKTAKAKELASELKQTINTTLSKIAELEQSAGNEGKKLELLLQQDSQTVSPLGLLLNSDKKVLLVTPESQADKLGIVSGDQILALRLDDQPMALSKSLELKGGQSISVDVKRDKVLKTLDGKVKTSESVAWKLQTESQTEQSAEVHMEQSEQTQESELAAEPTQMDENSCGRISVFFWPPEPKDYYSVSISQIDGRNIMRGREVVRLRPGKHVIKLFEYISARGLRVNRPNFVKAKELEIEVEANKTYHLAAEFDSTKRMISKGEPYWTPIVWKVTDKECEL